MFPNAPHHQPLTLTVASAHVNQNTAHQTNTLTVRHAAVSAENAVTAQRIKFLTRTRVNVSAPGLRNVDQEEHLAMIHVPVSALSLSLAREVKSLIETSADVNVTRAHTVLETLYSITNSVVVFATGNAAYLMSLTRAHVSVYVTRCVAQGTR